MTIRFDTNLQEGSSINRQNLNGNLETHHLAPTLFFHLHEFILKQDFQIPNPLSLTNLGDF